MYSITTYPQQPAGLLEVLDVSYCALSPGMFMALLQHPTLQMLVLDGCTGVTEGFRQAHQVPAAIMCQDRRCCPSVNASLLTEGFWDTQPTEQAASRWESCAASSVCFDGCPKLTEWVWAALCYER